jgi:membrane-associated protease RseP (regulator of RpoE activity)
MRSHILLKGLKTVLCFIFIFGSSTSWATSSEPTGGIGVILEFLPNKKIHRIRAVFQSSPAAKAGLKPGEEIVAIDGTSTSHMNFEELGRRVRGDPGTAITLTLRAPESTLTREVRLIRVSQQTVSPLILGAPGSTFPSPSGPTLSETERNQVKEIIRQLKTPEEQKKMQKLLTDFRDGVITKAEFLSRLKADFPTPFKP